mmetsp:Transcript_4552/g.10611  ORF Transcript_4552/g.10611 Transcript_4552/m.10611 type:complete len:353 (-) Transcript_4552:222-1280(-)
MLARPLLHKASLPCTRTCSVGYGVPASVDSCSRLVTGTPTSLGHSANWVEPRRAVMAVRTAEKTASSFGRGVAVLGFVGGLVWGLTNLLGLPPTHAAVAFGLQWAFFLLHGWPRRSEALYDASGSLTHLALVLAALTADATRSPRQLVVGVLSVVWCTRLGTFLFNRIARDKEDTRFAALKKGFWSFSIAWNLQVAWVFLLQLPVLVAAAQASQPGLGLLDAAGWLLWSVGFLIEATADAQKFAFRGEPKNAGRYITSGLWRYSRHPNYFGEITMWIGICLSCSACFSGWQWLGWISPAFNAFLLLFVSGVPLLEKAGQKRWGSEAEYRYYMENTSCIVPWFPAPSESDETV